MCEQFAICLTHDVDRVRKTYQYLTHDVKKGRWRNLRGLARETDPYWNFEKIMRIEDRYGVRSTWFFLEESIPFQPLRPRNWKLSLGRYSVREKKVESVIRKLDEDGWEIGLHGSYRSFERADLIIREKAILEGVLGKPVRGIRQHYLNLNIPATWEHQRAAGLEYDASFGYRRGLGWRQDRLNPFHHDDTGLWVVPLPLMECNLFSEAAGKWERAREVAMELIDQAERRGALLTVLWHPHVFSEADFIGYTEVYEEIIQEGRRRGARFLTCAQAVDSAQKDLMQQPSRSLPEWSAGGKTKLSEGKLPLQRSREIQ